MKKEDVIKEVTDDPLFQGASKDLSVEEKAKVEASLKAFVDDIVAPLVDGFEQALADPSTREALKELLRNGNRSLVKK